MTANASKFYNHLSRKFQFPQFKKLIKGVRVSEDWKCVDVGCGTGMGTRYLAEMVSRGTVVGIDPSEDRVEEASRHAKDNITYHVAKAQDTHKLVSECDMITCNYVMQWMMSREEKQESLNAFYRSLRPRGLVAINVMTGIAYDALHWGDQELCQMMYQHMAFNTAQIWKDMALQVGFKIVACEETVDESQAYDSFDDYLTMFAASWQMYYDFHHLLHKLRATVDEQKMVKWNGGKHRLVAPNLFLLLQK